MATRYWAGNGGNWATTSNWSSTSDLLGVPASAPTAADDVYFTSSSPGDLVLSANAACRSLDCTGYTHSLTGASLITIGTTTVRSDNVMCNIPTTTGVTCSVSFSSSSATQVTITWGGSSGTRTGSITFASTGNYKLLDTVKTTNVGGTSIVIQSSHTMDTNGQTITTSGTINASAGAWTWTLGASVITALGLNGLSGTVNANTSSITLTGTNPTVALGGKTLYDLTFTGGGTATITGGGTLHNLTRSVSSNTVSMNFASTVATPLTYTINGTFSVTGTSVTQRCLISNSQTANSGVDAAGQATVNTAAFSFAYCDLMDIAAGGAGGSWTGTSLGNIGGNSGITFDAPRTLYFRSGSSQWVNTASWALGASSNASATTIPIAQDTAIFDNGSTTGLGTVTVASPTVGWAMPTIDAHAYTNVTYTLTLGNTSNALYFAGDITLGSRIVWGFTGTCNYYARGARVIHANGATGFNGTTWNINHDKATSSVSLSSDLPHAGSGSFTLVGGNFYTNDNAFSTYSLIVNDNFQGGTSTITIAGPNLTFPATHVTWDLSTTTINFTLAVGTITTTSPTDGSTLTLGTVTFVAGTNTINWGVTGTPVSVASIMIPGTSTRTVSFPNTFTVRNGGAGWSVSGTSGHVMTINSYSAATWTLSVASGVVASDYISISKSHAAGGASFFAGPLTDSTDGGGNTGWIFGNYIGLTAVAAASLSDAPIPIPGLTLAAVAASATATAPVAGVVAQADITIVAVPASSIALSPIPTPANARAPPSANATAEAPVPVVSTGTSSTVVAASAEATATSPVPTVITALTVVAVAAETTATAPSPTVSITVVTSSANATALASVPEIDISEGIAAPSASAGASAPVPTVLVVQDRTVLAPASQGLANASVPQAFVSLVAASATASAVAPISVITVGIRSPAASASASASALAIAHDITVTVPSASASASAAVSTVVAVRNVTVISPAALVITNAPVPAVLAVRNATVLAPVASVNATAFAPGILAIRNVTLAPLGANVSATAPVPMPGVSLAALAAASVANASPITLAFDLNFAVVAAEVIATASPLPVQLDVYFTIVPAEAIALAPAFFTLRQGPPIITDPMEGSWIIELPNGEVIARLPEYMFELVEPPIIKTT